MNWLEIKLIMPAAQMEIVANLFEELNAGGVQISDDVATDLDLNDGQVGVSAYLTTEIDQTQFITQLKTRVLQLQQAGWLAPNLKILTKNIDENDWTTSWQDYYEPVQVTRYLTIVPQWQDYQPQSNLEQLIRLNPGKSFGTGMHPTTRLALSCLELTLRGGEKVFDVGTGSGVLSIAAAKLGADAITATEYDAAALPFAQENIALNHLTDQIKLIQGSLLTPVVGRADLIVANMLPETLLPLIPQLAAHLEADGTVILTGIIAAQLGKIEAAVTAHHFSVDLQLKLADWYCLRLKQVEVDA
ncbi:50S ribosomal protein L11 methyltransferase [Lapidilactobacillus bayanensis]|uniref:50S ribosomal protein L11 methyltransferase n=1 Tax=Lapidilactobacillus bayanensis TaxID=2485998 RepID=UPI000F7965E5|nr:50S ribosomal protein L11 methyltransferase [Lapidilactobacillus bayanensis]